MPFHFLGRVAVAVFLTFVGAAQAADDKPWTVSKSSGEVWTVTAGAQPVSLSQQADLRPGDTIRTGRNGRVLQVRGEESILVAPNSAIGIPQRAADNTSTTIVQQAGSILLDVEKRNVQHFEVETPYLAAVVKGTQFRVSVGPAGTSVNVMRGQVQVADFKSGQIAQVMPGQSAASFAQGRVGLALTGSGAFSPIEQGKPRPSPVERLMVPKNGLTVPRNAAAGTQVRTVGQLTPAAAVTRATAATPAVPVTAARTTAAAKPAASPFVTPARSAGGVRIAAPIGDVRLNFSKVTNGLARGTTAPSLGRAVAARDSTIWTSRDGKSSPATVAQGNTSDPGNANSVSNVAAMSPGVAAAAAPMTVAPVNSEAGPRNASNNGQGSAATRNGNGTQASNNNSGRDIGRPGRGLGNGASNGNGPGPGNGPGNGPGPGLGNRPGNGPGPVIGPGNGNGPGLANGPGNGNGAGLVNGPGNGNGAGPGSGPNR